MNSIVKTETTKYHTIVIHSSGACVIFDVMGNVTTLPAPTNPALDGVMARAKEIVASKERMIDAMIG